MSARVSQQYIEILTQAPSKARVSQQYVEVLTANAGSVTHEENVSDSFSLTDDTTKNLSRLLEVTSNLEVSSEALRPQNFSKIVPDPLGLSQEATFGNEIELSASSTLDFESDPRGDQFATANNEIDFEDLAIFFFFIREGWLVVDSLNITDEVDFLIPLRPYVTQTINLSETIDLEQPRYESRSQLISFSSVVGYSFGTRHITLEDTINFYSYIPFTLNATSTLNLTDEAERRWWPIDSISFVETALGAKSKEVDEGELDLNSATSVTGIFTRGSDHSLGLSSSVSYFRDDIACVLKDYTPFNGEGSVIPDSLPAQKRDPTVNRVTLSWPNTQFPSKQVTLRAPEIDDIQRRSTTRVYQESLGGRIYVYQNPNWPKYDTIICTFTALTYATAIEFQDFMYETIGHEIELGDWNGNIWRGIVINPEEPIVCDSKVGYTVSFQLEGVKQTSQLTAHDITLSGVAEFELIYGLFDTITLSDSLSLDADYTRDATIDIGLTDVSTSSTS